MTELEPVADEISRAMCRLAQQLAYTATKDVSQHHRDVKTVTCALSSAQSAIAERDARIAELKEEVGNLRLSAKWSADWANQAIADMKAAEARAEAAEALLKEAGEGLHDLERYVALNCYDQWLPEGHAKTSVLSRKLDAARSLMSKIGERNGE